MAAVNVRICSHCLHFETVCSLCFWGCHWHKIKPNPAAMTNITKWMWKDFPRGSIKSTSGDLALCANHQSSIFTVSPRCLQRWQVESAAFVWLSFLLLGSQGQPDDWGGIALGEPEGPPDKKLHSEVKYRRWVHSKQCDELSGCCIIHTSNAGDRAIV